MDPEGSMPWEGRIHSQGGEVMTTWAICLKSHQLTTAFQNLAELLCSFSYNLTFIISRGFLPGGGKVNHQGFGMIGNFSINFCLIET